MITYQRQPHWFLGGDIVGVIDRNGWKKKPDGYLFALFASRVVQDNGKGKLHRISAAVTQDPTGRGCDFAMAVYHMYSWSFPRGIQQLSSFLRLNYGEVGNRPEYHLSRFNIKMLGSNNFTVYENGRADARVLLEHSLKKFRREQ